MYCCCLFLSHIWLFVTPWTVACLVSLSMGISSQGYWSSSPFLSSGDLLNPGIKPTSPASLLHCKLILYHSVVKPYVCVCVCVCVCACVDVHLCVHVYMYFYTCICILSMRIINWKSWKYFTWDNIKDVNVYWKDHQTSQVWPK